MVPVTVSAFRDCRIEARREVPRYGLPERAGNPNGIGGTDSQETAMIPLHDDNPTTLKPIVTVTVIVPVTVSVPSLIV